MTNLNATFNQGKSYADAQSSTPYHLVAAGTINATNVKTSTGWLCTVAGYNIAATPRYLKLYDTVNTPDPSTMTPKLVFMMPGNTSGAGFNISFDYSPVLFSSGIAFVLVVGIADNNTTTVGASECVVTLTYK